MTGVLVASAIGFGIDEIEDTVMATTCQAAAIGAWISGSGARRPPTWLSTDTRRLAGTFRPAS